MLRTVQVRSGTTAVLFGCSSVQFTGAIQISEAPPCSQEIRFVNLSELGERRQQQSRPVDVLEHQFAVMWSKLVPSSRHGKCDFTRTLIFPIWTAFERIRRILSLSLMDSPTPLFALTSMVPAL